MEENELIYRRWIEEVWNKGKEEVIDELFDKDGVAFYPYFVKGDEPIRGIEKFKEFYRLVRENFSDLEIRISDLVAEDNKVVALCFISAVQDAAESEDLPTDEQAELRSLCQFKIKNGKIVEIWNNIDLTDQNPKAALLKLKKN